MVKQLGHFFLEWCEVFVRKLDAGFEQSLRPLLADDAKECGQESDLLTVNETASEPPHEEGNSINAPRNLALEATFINHNFSQQVLKMGEDKHSFENVNPFIQDDEEGEVASVAYRYRKFDLGDNVGLIVRCEHDGAMVGPNGELQFVSIKALNEWDPRFSGGIDWRQKLDTQRGAVLANELKNNSCKLAKWTVQALLAGSDQIKFGDIYQGVIVWEKGTKYALCIWTLLAKFGHDARFEVQIAITPHIVCAVSV
ncbi:hypothetical protein HPB51_001388 [Rhipicephalus microplus]|uniref:Eukaryotic translation initiation factor 3 subunit p66 n=1 Tax=Rhipicephalus microplus TaxID=6941 RepID=A0A9J6DXY4_RHIMP|nr:hypothetical protein HPB51_001388 [Rhipicephalus microplus]